ncbi:MATE family efflux transporter [Micrococcoides hystricis]|uniref:MATE family efflux transporter n=1 Tax=Micrococcoides hystricis TaxID=1572761 RepID=A0ABV6PBN8_9MICC
MTSADCSPESENSGAVPPPSILGRQIIALALPALGALIAEPIFLLADAAIIGRLGVPQLAGFALGSVLIQTVVGMMIFLAYSTTSSVARAVGARREGLALAMGRDGLAVAFILGLVLVAGGALFAGPTLQLMGGEGDTYRYAADYVLASLPGLPAMLLVLAATGLLRGFQDTKTPLVVAAAGFGANIALNLLLVYGFQLSVFGAGLGTSIAQWGMAIAYLWIILPRMRAADVRFRPTRAGMLANTKVGSWLMLRTASMRVAFLITVWVATDLGDTILAAHQLIMTVYSTLAFVLDALAIAAQAMIGKELGAGRLNVASTLNKTMMRWGIYFGIATGLILGLLAPLIAPLFSPDQGVQEAFTVGMWVLAVSQPVAGLVFVLDGVLIGAGDARYLALAGVINLAIYVPALVAVVASRPEGLAAIVWLWVAFGIVYLGARAATLAWRVRNEKWMVAGLG